MSNAVAAEKTPNTMTVFRHELDSMAGQFKNALPAHIPAERFTRVLMTAVQNNPKLLACTRQSLWNACMRAAQDGLLPDGRDGAIVPYGENDEGKKGSDIAQWMPMIGGLRKKARNSGEISTWEAQVVCQNDKFEYELGDEPFIRHAPALGDRGTIIAAYSIATLKDGSKSREVMTIKEIEGVRSKSKAKNGPWKDPIFYPEMCRKVVARRHSKVLPMSSDLDDLIRRDDELYDLEGAREEAAQSNAGRPKGLAGKLDLIAGGRPADETVTDIEGDAATDTAATGKEKPKKAEATPKAAPAVGKSPGTENPDEFLKWVDDVYAAATDLDGLKKAAAELVGPDVAKLLPPDQADVEDLYRKHEQRLGAGQ